MTKDELKLAFQKAFQMGQDYWYYADHEFESYNKKSDAIRAKFNEMVKETIEEALAQEKALQALHDENERLGLYKDAYAQPEEEKLHPVHIGVDVTREGTAVTAFYRKPDAVMEMFYSQFHPMAQPEQEPVAYLCENAVGHKYFRWKKPSSTYKPIALYTTPPKRTWVGLTEQEQGAIMEDLNTHGTNLYPFAQAIEAKLKDKNT